MIAPGSSRNPVAKAYNIDGIPHYYLIDQDGKIVDNNAADPFEKRLSQQLDELLKI
ncbi:TlpA family protein disulfide reductase [Mucilaginibacter antarcticus]|uniref:TlpA family protein disulfide reductase n=1 Tax=Mucilaginibacter antarcticus TaxID=1855725 RepID=UPI003644B4C6